MHDMTLERVTHGSDMRSVASMTLDALRSVRLPQGERIPTLRDVLSFCASKNLFVNIEVKRDVPARIRSVVKTARILRQNREQCEVVVSSFDPFMLIGMAALAPRAAMAVLLHPDHQRLAPVASLVRAVSINPSRKLVTARFVRRCHRRNLRVVPWTVNDYEEARRLLTLGVDGIITDDPGKLSPLFV
jgi:glycerophosphoryl diester phosphodiesterase